MSAKHTPAPWEYSGGAIFGVSPLNARVRLADIVFHNRLNRIDSEANARLIAKSPELHAFAALIARMLLAGEDQDGRPYEQSDEDAQDTLASLITKARGLIGIAGPGKPICAHFQSDGRGCCINCNNFHGPDDSNQTEGHSHEAR